MRGVSVVITTYRRAWALPNVLTSLTRQTVPSDEVVVVLKPSGDGSEDVIREYAEKLPIKLVIQGDGNAAEAAELWIRNCSHDYVLFVDDDAIVREDWVERYVRLFSELRDAGGSGDSLTRPSTEGRGLNSLRRTSTPRNLLEEGLIGGRYRSSRTTAGGYRRPGLLELKHAVNLWCRPYASAESTWGSGGRPLRVAR